MSKDESARVDETSDEDERREQQLEEGRRPRPTRDGRARR